MILYLILPGNSSLLEAPATGSYNPQEERVKAFVVKLIFPYGQFSFGYSELFLGGCGLCVLLEGPNFCKASENYLVTFHLLGSL